MEVVTKITSAVCIFCFVRTCMHDSEFHLKKKYRREHREGPADRRSAEEETDNLRQDK